MDGSGEGRPGGIGGRGADDVEEACDGVGGLVRLVPAGCEGRPGGHERIIEVNRGVHDIIVDVDVAVGVAINDIEGKVGAGRARVHVKATGDGEGGDVESGAVWVQAEQRCGCRLSQRTTAVMRRRPRRTEQRVLAKTVVQLSLVHRAMRQSRLLIGAADAVCCLLWCML